MKTLTIPSANGAAPILIEKILDSELGAHCALYARTGHGVDNSAGTEPIVFMALIVNA